MNSLSTLQLAFRERETKEHRCEISTIVVAKGVILVCLVTKSFHSVVSTKPQATGVNPKCYLKWTRGKKMLIYDLKSQSLRRHERQSIKVLDILHQLTCRIYLHTDDKYDDASKLVFTFRIPQPNPKKDPEEKVEEICDFEANFGS